MDYMAGVADAADALSKGDLSREVKVRSEHDLLSRNFKGANEALRGLTSEIQGLVAAAQKGQLEKRGQSDRFQGVYREIVQGINELLDEVVSPLNEAASVLERVAARDLSVRVQGNYAGDFAKIKVALNTALGNLSDALAQVSQGAEQVTSSAGQISSGSQSLSQGASEQAGSLEEVSSGLQQLASMAKQNASSAKEARALSDTARASTAQGVDSMRRLTESVQKINSSAAATAKIVKTIDEIAFQTNLLALNAAVEAARAGDAGKGFAVVAEEVRNLAIRSAEAAKNTAALIEESVRNSEEGAITNQEVILKLDEINGHIQKVSGVMVEIVTASESQDGGAQKIASSVEQVTRVTQQVAANTEESASAAQELSAQAMEMLRMVETFTMSGSKERSRMQLPQSAVRKTKPDVARGKVNGQLSGNVNGMTPLKAEKAIPFF